MFYLGKSDISQRHVAATVALSNIRELFFNNVTASFLSSWLVICIHWISNCSCYNVQINEQLLILVVALIAAITVELSGCLVDLCI